MRLSVGSNVRAAACLLHSAQGLIGSIAFNPLRSEPCFLEFQRRMNL
jgi:hypothetical protein